MCKGGILGWTALREQQSTLEGEEEEVESAKAAGWRARRVKVRDDSGGSRENITSAERRERRQ